MQGNKQDSFRVCVPHFKVAMEGLVAFVLLLTIASVPAKRFSIMAPNVFHVGVKERVSVAVFDPVQAPVRVSLYLQDFPLRRKMFSQVQGVVNEGQTIFLYVKVDPEHIMTDRYKQFVYLVARSDDSHFAFHRTAKILLSYRDGVVLLQTDKPIYTPKQSVRIRVFPLGLDLKPSNNKVTLVVENPQGVRVRKWKDLSATQGVIKKRLLLGNNEIIGVWKIAVLYGLKQTTNSSVQFEVREYVLPKFSVKLSVPTFILNTDEFFNIRIDVRYTYGKAVQGFATLLLKVDADSVDSDAVQFDRHPLILGRSGVTLHKQRMNSVRTVTLNGSFPEGRRLLVEVSVVEQATGHKETSTDNSCYFTSSPYRIEFINTPKYFMPSLPVGVKVIVMYPNKQPAKGVPVFISAKKSEPGRSRLEDFIFRTRSANTDGKTNSKGIADFKIDACSTCNSIVMKVKTDNPDLEANQNAEAIFKIEAVQKTGRSFIMVRPVELRELDDKFKCESVRVSSERARLSFAVIARGKIVYHNVTEPTQNTVTSWSFFMTPEMSPSMRLIVYYIDIQGGVVADSILITIEDDLSRKVSFSAETFRKQDDGTTGQVVESKPGSLYQLKIQAPEGTLLGILGVDESVYLLRDKNKLTAKRILQAVEELDLGCGVGRGRNSMDIFKNAGVVLLTDRMTSYGRENHGCEESSRQKRDINATAGQAINLEMCCHLGEENVGITCWKRLADSTRTFSRECRKEFWTCCSKKYGIKDTGMLARSNQVEIDSFLDSETITDDQIFEGTHLRADFRETWLFHEGVASHDGRFRLNATVPDTITTWVMQAVAINNQTGLGLAKPLRIVGFLEQFVSLKLPYSVKRGEQVSLLATVFNYVDSAIKAKVFLIGSKDFCSMAGSNGRVLIGTVDVPVKDAKSVAVPIVATKLGWIEIEVFVIFQHSYGPGYVNVGGDRVRKKLLVEPEGVKQRLSQSFVLDPADLLGSDSHSGEKKLNISRENQLKMSSRRDSHGQSDAVLLKKASTTIEGSVGAVVYVTGNVLGPVVNTTIEGGLAEKFILPSGCPEQTMYKMAPNVYVLKYLTKIKRVTGADEKKAYDYIQRGYHHQLTHLRKDKAYGYTGGSTPASTWLTAFVMRVFCEARQFEGIYISMDVVCDSLNYIVNVQRGNGAFYEQRRSYLAGGAYSDGDVSMTAFVLSALAECDCKGVKARPAMLKAQRYLESRLNGLTNPYSMALTAYALTRVGSHRKHQANEKLIQNALFDEGSKSRYWNTPSRGLNVQTAGYALMTQLHLGRTAYAGPIVRYITDQRRDGVSFVSTQDTVVALQALSLYSEKTENTQQDLRIRLTAEKDDSWEQILRITPDNSLLQNEFDIKNLLGGNLFVDSSGTGVALAQVEIWYNVPSSRGKTCNFVLRVTTHETKEEGEIFGPTQNDEEAGDSNSKHEKRRGNRKGRKGKKKGKGGKRGSGGKGKQSCQGKKKKEKKCRQQKKPPKFEPVNGILLKVCTRYKGAESAGMSIIDIGLLTGFKPDKDLLNEVKQALPDLFLEEESDRALILYFLKIPNDQEICLNILLKREHYVGVVQPVPVNVYDYYEPDRSCSVFYGPDKSSTLRLGVCDVGSRSCRCTQDECPPKAPIEDAARLMKMACKLQYVIKGRVLYVDEEETMITYDVLVVQIIQQGNQDQKVGSNIKIQTRGVCHRSDLKHPNEYLFMGRDVGGDYRLNKGSFVMRWPSDPNSKEKKMLDNFARNFRC